MIKRVLYALGILFIIIQFIRPEKNQTAGPYQHDITTKFPMNETVSISFKTACYDCHSNNSKYPWYYNIQPVSWWLQHHIDEGKSELNFNEFALYSPEKQDHKLDEIAEAVTDGWMPLKTYRFVHKESVLNEDQKKAIISWVNESRSLLNKRPSDNHEKNEHQ
jgi:hypothetical protein